MQGRNYVADPRRTPYRALTAAERAARERRERVHPLPCADPSCGWHHAGPATLQGPGGEPDG